MDKPKPSQPEAVLKFGLGTTEGVQELFGTEQSSALQIPRPPMQQQLKQQAIEAEAPPKKR